MNKWVGRWAIVSAFCLALGIAGCGTGTEDGRVKINVPTASASGALYAVGAAMTHMWNEQIPDIRAATQSSAGGVDNLNRVADGEAQVSMAIVSDVDQCLHGRGAFVGHAYPDLKIMAGLYVNPNQVVLASREQAENLRDLRGKRIAVASAGSSVYDQCRIHFTEAGLRFPEDIRSEYISFSDGAELLQNGALDGAWIMAGTPASAVAQALAGGGRLLSFDEEFLKALKEDYSWYSTYTIPAGTYPNQGQEVRTSAVKMILFCRGDLDEELVYAMTKALWMHMEELGKDQKNLAGLTAEEAVRGIGDLPLHGGAERYYREIGVLPAE